MTSPSEDYRLIPLTQGQVSTVDVNDFDVLSKFRWYAHWNHKTKSFYARTRINGKGVLMHRFLMGVVGSRIEVDHINMNSLDNRKRNLRLADHSQNQCNRTKRSDNKSGYKGVHWSTQKRKWHAEIMINQKKKHLGFFSCPEDAHAAYCSAAAIFHGEYARTQ